jgi:ATP-dependent RNA helicase DDX24/MAK5
MCLVDDVLHLVRIVQNLSHAPAHTLPRSPLSQRARFKAVESLQTSKARTVVVATDVAARGLDIPSVATVIHYDAARSIDTFVHRSGRTAVRYYCAKVLRERVCR